MGSIIDIVDIASGGHRTVQDDWLPATAIRPLLHEDPCLIWLQHHGAKHGLERDPDDTYSFLAWIGEKGREFEDAWVRNVVGPLVAVQALSDDRDVRSVDGLRRTLEIMDAGAPVVTKAALWWAPERIYGSADIVCKSSWLYTNFPHLQPKRKGCVVSEPEHWVVIDAKFQTELGSDASKRHDFEAAANQVRLYSYMIGQLTGITPKQAYLATRDCPLTLVEVDVSPPTSNGGLPIEVVALRDECLAIKQDGANWLPWTHARTGPNFTNGKNAPWSHAVKKIADTYYEGGPLEKLPGIGRTQATALQAMGYRCIADVLAAPSGSIAWESIRGIGGARAERLRECISAARSGVPRISSSQHVPAKADIELFVDFEFLSNANVDFDREWPYLRGQEMVFMVGVGWDEDGHFRYRQFVAQREDMEAESDLFRRFTRFLDDKGVFNPNKSVALYHWSAAEVWQAKRAAARHSLPAVDSLPWCDLRKVFLEGKVSVPGTYGLGLKGVAQAIGRLDAAFKTDWPGELAEGLSAMVMGWVMYSYACPVGETEEMETLTRYLEADVKALHTVLTWLREFSGKSRADRSVCPKVVPSLHWWTRQIPTKGVQPVKEGRCMSSVLM